MLIPVTGRSGRLQVFRRADVFGTYTGLLMGFISLASVAACLL